MVRLVIPSLYVKSKLSTFLGPLEGRLTGNLAEVPRTGEGGDPMVNTFSVESMAVGPLMNDNETDPLKSSLGRNKRLTCWPAVEDKLRTLVPRRWYSRGGGKGDREREEKEPIEGGSQDQTVDL